MHRWLHRGEDRRGRRVAWQCRKQRRTKWATAGNRGCAAGLHEPADGCSDGSGLLRTARVKHERQRGLGRLDDADLDDGCERGGTTVTGGWARRFRSEGDKRGWRLGSASVNGDGNRRTESHAGRLLQGCFANGDGERKGGSRRWAEEEKGKKKFSFSFLFI